MTMADPGTARALLLGSELPGFQDSIQVTGHVENPRLLGLGILGLEIELAVLPTDLLPPQRKHLAHPHAAVIGEADRDLSVIGKSTPKREEVFMLKEAAPHIVLGKVRDMRCLSDFRGRPLHR